MPKASLRTLYLVTAVLCNVQRSLEHEIPRRSFLSRRAIDGTRGRKYFDPDEDGAFDSYGSAGGQYDPYDHVTDLSDIRRNVPGEPGIDYPAYTTLPQTGFTCEGRSRGYYADEAAGCQVFHVCHDVLVSSFLCPIGSTFSQKLLTCDWWTKVDCSSTGRYLEVNRNSYQIDDDEMIRNAYAMISLQSSTEDVTKDGLVDPDSGARIIDYSALGAGRFVTGYTPGFRRVITDYTAAGNDLPVGFEIDYPHEDNRRVLASYERYDQQQRANSNVYRGKFQMEDKGRSPYHASPIIRHDYQHRSNSDNEFQDDYRRPIGGFTDQLQASYAPTVPTVTTTTRRLYSPTVPTTYRPSTLAYSKLDLMMDSSDHLYAHSESSVTPATAARHDDDAGNIDLRKSESRHGVERDPTGSDGVSTPRGPGGRDDAARRSKEAHKARLDLENGSETSFRINVTDTIDEEEVFRQQNDKPVTVDDNQDSLEDIETKDSIGIARALNDPPRTVVRDQSRRPVDQLSKSERTNGLTTPIPVSRTGQDRLPGNVNITNPSGSKSETGFNETNGDRSTRDYVIAISTTTKSPAETYTRSFGDRTTPLLRTWQPRNDGVVQPSFISLQTAKSATSTTERNVHVTYSGHERFSLNDNRTFVNHNSSAESIDGSRVDVNFGIPPPAEFLKPPMESFFINVPEGRSRYTTIVDGSLEGWNPGTTTTTQVPRFFGTLAGNNRDEPSSYNKNIEESLLTDYDESVPETSSLGIRPTVQLITETTTSTPWLVYSTYSPDQPIANVPATDIVPPIVDYNDGFGDFVPPREHSRDTEQSDHAQNSQNTRNTPPATKRDNETEVLSRYNTGFAFTIRDAIKAQPDHSASPCSSDEQILRFCEMSSAAPSGPAISTPGAHERTVSIGTKANRRIPERFFYSSSTKSPEESMTTVSSEFSASTARTSISTEDSILKTEVTPRGVTPRMKNPEERAGRTETVTESSLPRSIRPGTRLKQIEEAIDEHNSSYKVSFAVKRNEDLQPIADDFISRLIAQHQRPASVLNEQLDGFEIVKSVEPDDDKVAGISRLPEFPEASRELRPNEDNGSSFVAVNDTIDRSRHGETNVSMLNLLHLMAELLKLDRLPRPFSAKDLRSVELRDSFSNLNLDDQSASVTTSPSLDLSNANSKSSTSFDSFLRPPAEPETGSLNLDPDKPSFVTVNPPFDHSRGRTPFGSNSKPPDLDFTKTSTTNIAQRPKTSLDLDRNKPSSITAGPLLDRSQTGTPFRDADIVKAPTVDTVNIARSKTLLNLNIDRPPAVTATPLSDYTQSRGPFANADPERFSFDVTSKAPASKHVAFNPSAGVPFAINNATERKASQLESANKTVRPLQKERILEQLAENFGRPLYRDDSVRKSLMFDLPQVQRSLDFESGLPITKESVRATDESEAENPAETAAATTTTTTTQRTSTTTESVKTIVETEFVPSLGFSFDTNEDREQYAQAILGGLIDEEAGRNDRNESSVAQLTDEIARNATLRLEQREKDGDGLRDR